MQAERHFLVTGAGSGIGRAIAIRLAGDGARVTLIGRRVEPLQATAEAAGSHALALACDVREAPALAGALARAVEQHGPLHAAVAVAGIGGPNPPGPGDRFDELVETNLNGSYRTFRAALDVFADGPAPRRLVAFSSILARIGVPGYTGYCASKAGILGLVRSLAVELAGDNILVNAICPGWVDTEMSVEGLSALAADTGVDLKTATARAMEEVPLGRMSTPAEIAGVVAWLLSPDAATVTGQGIDVNGGAWLG